MSRLRPSGGHVSKHTAGITEHGRPFDWWDRRIALGSGFGPTRVWYDDNSDKDYKANFYDAKFKILSKKYGEQICWWVTRLQANVTLNLIQCILQHSGQCSKLRTSGQGRSIRRQDLARQQLLIRALRAVSIWVSKVMSCLRWFRFATLSDRLKKELAILSNPIRRKTKTNRDLLIQVFPRLMPFTCICFDFWLVRFVTRSCCDW